jgi:hypothetical protein
MLSFFFSGDTKGKERKEKEFRTLNLSEQSQFNINMLGFKFKELKIFSDSL